MTTTTHQSICRICPNYCSVHVDVEDNHILRIVGDAENPVWKGYTCAKGRSHRDMYQHHDRILHPRKRLPDGSTREISMDQALDEIATKLAAIVERDGPRAAALYMGFYAFLDSPANPTFIDAFMNALGSRMIFNTNTIDQPGKGLAKGFLGAWMAPGRDCAEPEVALLFGNNPLISHLGPTGVPVEVARRLPDGLIVVDPRRTESAMKARLHLQPWPGQDHAILAGIIRVILAEGIQDDEFIGANVAGLDALRATVDPFTPERVARLAGIPAEDLVEAALLFGRARSAYAVACTGANMTARGTLVEYLILVLHTIRGHWLREGDRITNDTSMLPQYLVPAKAQAIPPFPAYDYGEPLRVRGFKETIAGYQVAALPDEILMPGEGQIRALICTGGNPAGALPNHLKAVEALESLELFVTVDVQPSATTRLAQYVIPGRLPHEMPGSTLYLDFLTAYATGFGLIQPYAQVSPAVVEPPEGSEVVAQWEFLFLLAQRMGLQLEVYPGYGSIMPGGTPTRIDMSRAPTDDELFDLLHTGSRVPWREVRDAGGGLWPDTCREVEPKDPGWEGRLDVGNPEMMAELAAVAERATVDETFPLHLISRRMAHVMNTPTPALPPGKPSYNWLNVHPDDLACCDLKPGELAELSSARSTITCMVRDDDTMRPGVVSMTHQFGGLPDRDDDLKQVGSSVAQLIADDDVYDPFSGQPRMSNVPVRLSRLPLLVDEARTSAALRR